jgi:Tfp pilus assembly protein PilN
MPLHVNLYHEVQQQERARQRDPVRLTMLGLLIICIGFVANYFVVLEREHSISIRYGLLQSQWAKIEPKAKDAKARQDELNAEIAASDAMMKAVDSRIYWAPVLGEVLKTVPRSVQLTHVGGESPADETLPDSVLTITGISSSPEPRQEAETVRTALNASLGTQYKKVTSIFKDLDDSDQFVMLDGRHLPTASFTMEFQIQVRDPVGAAAPAPARKSRGEAE